MTLTATALLVMSGCSQSPAAPGNAIPSFRAGSYRLHLTGYGISTDPAFPVCENPLIAGGTNVVTAIDFAVVGGEWVGRSKSAIGADLEITFSEKESTIAIVYVEGRSRGTALDMQYRADLPATGVRIEIQGESGSFARLEGDFGRGATIATGSISGRITFTDVAGRASTCRTIGWSLIAISSGETG